MSILQWVEFNWHLVEKQVVSCKKARRINEQCCFVPTKVKSQGLKKETIFDMVLFTLYKVWNTQNNKKKNFLKLAKDDSNSSTENKYNFTKAIKMI